MSKRQAGKTGIALLNFGGPRDISEVPGFIREILRDPNTIQLPVPQPVQDFLAGIIARRRSVSVAGQYEEIGGSSPIVNATGQIRNTLAKALTKALKGSPPEIYVLHRYLPGQAKAEAERIIKDGVEELLALPLYPHFSYTTTGSSLEQLSTFLAGAGFKGRVSVLRSYPDTPGYLQALSDRLKETLKAAAPPTGSTVILCSAHGLPVSYVRHGDPYRLELYKTMEGLRRSFPEWRFELSFQSRVGPAEWLKPYTDEIIPELAAAGTTHVIFLPLSFVNDHIETIHEIGVTYFELAKAHSITPHLVRAVEDHKGHIGVLAEAVTGWLAGHCGVPVAELLPPSQWMARKGWLLAAAALAALVLALTQIPCS
ncbi:MAG: ferrochelatase [Deltaproteobacteria bacterium]|nr:ferrochelatase [Deltaproteobacteria bacterium]